MISLQSVSDFKRLTKPENRGAAGISAAAAAVCDRPVKGHKQADIDSLLPWSHQRKV